MTQQEAQAWAMHVFGGRAFAHSIPFRGGNCFTVGVFGNRGIITTLGDSRHSYELAFQHAGKPVDMNHAAIARVSLAEAMQKETGTQATQTALFV